MTLRALDNSFYCLREATSEYLTTNYEVVWRKRVQGELFFILWLPQLTALLITVKILQDTKNKKYKIGTHRAHVQTCLPSWKLWVTVLSHVFESENNN